jgi:hypothetical protein
MRTTGIREGDIVYLRARATKEAEFFDDGIRLDGITLVPLDREGNTHEYILAPKSAVISAAAIESAVTKKIKERYGIQ